jgi:hypothetical protein
VGVGYCGLARPQEPILFSREPVLKLAISLINRKAAEPAQSTHLSPPPRALLVQRGWLHRRPPFSQSAPAKWYASIKQQPRAAVLQNGAHKKQAHPNKRVICICHRRPRCFVSLANEFEWKAQPEGRFLNQSAAGCQQRPLTSPRLEKGNAK